MTTEVDPHLQALRDLLLADVQASIARAQQSADEAAAQGDERRRKWHQDEVDRLTAITFPWQEEEQAA